MSDKRRYEPHEVAQAVEDHFLKLQKAAPDPDFKTLDLRAATLPYSNIFLRLEGYPEIQFQPENSLNKLLGGLKSKALTLSFSKAELDAVFKAKKLELLTFNLKVVKSVLIDDDVEILKSLAFFKPEREWAVKAALQIASDTIREFYSTHGWQADRHEEPVKLAEETRKLTATGIYIDHLRKIVTDVVQKLEFSNLEHKTGEELSELITFWDSILKGLSSPHTVEKLVGKNLHDRSKREKATALFAKADELRSKAQAAEQEAQTLLASIT